MRESELGSMLSTALRHAGWTVFKLRNDAMQRGLPDYVMWRQDHYPMLFELKKEATLGAAVASLSSGQESVMASLAKSSTGAILVWGCEESCGVAVVRGNWKTFKDYVGSCNANMIFTVPSSGKRSTVGILVELLLDYTRGAYVWSE